MKVESGITVKYHDGVQVRDAVVLNVQREKKTVDLRVTRQGGETRDYPGVHGSKTIKAGHFTMLEDAQAAEQNSEAEVKSEQDELPAGEGGDQ